MAFVNKLKREIQTKVVYYGPGRGGKTTNLEYIHEKYTNHIKSDMISIKTQGDRTLFFDFFPFDLGQIMGFNIKIQLYTVPGQPKYDSTRRLVLQGVDGLVFVADSLAVRRQDNFESLKNLQKNLASYGKDIFKIPLVLQYNKRDLKGVPLMPVGQMEKELNRQLKSPSFEASAVTGYNIVPTLKKIISQTMISLQNLIS